MTTRFIHIALPGAVLLAHVAPSFGTFVPDPVADLLPGAWPPELDLVGISVMVSENDVCFKLHFDPQVTNPDDLIELSGYIDLDLDQNVMTGRISHIDEFCPPPSVPMGVDYYLLFWSYLSQADLFRVDNGDEVLMDSYTVVFSGPSAKVVVPRVESELDPGLPISQAFDCATLPGNSMGATDRLPNGSDAPEISPLAADVDGDHDVDLIDFATCQTLYTDAGGGLVEGGEVADFDCDDDVDADDLDQLDTAYTGPD